MLDLQTQNKVLDSLKEKGVLDEKVFNEIKEKFGNDKEMLEKIQNERIVSGEKIAETLGQLFNLQNKSLINFKPLANALEIITEDFAKTYGIFVFEKKESVVKVAIVDPTNLKAQEAMDYVAREKKLKIEYYVVTPADFKNLLKFYSELKSEVSDALNVAKDKLEEKEDKSKEKTKEKDEEFNLDEAVKSAPVAKMISVILRHAVEEKASDIHIEPYSDSSRVRYRVDGVLHNSLVLPKYVHAALVSRIKVLANLKIDETRIPQDGRIRLNILGKDIDFRVSTLPLYEQEKVVMRILDTSGGALTLDQLGFADYNLEVIQENIKKPHGMFLVTGPTGSGKSTTLYSILNILNKEGVNIVTLEDPVEYFLAGVNQAQVRAEVGLTFASGLRSILRQDPDIIMVGEIRDNETAELAVHASMTGHIVLSTLHTNDAIGAIPRLVDMKIESYLLSSTINVIIAQRLVRKICSDCKKETTLPEKTLAKVIEEMKKIPEKSIPEEFKNMKNLTFYAGKGCDSCNQTGYKGRLGIVEVLNITDRLKEIISSGNFGKVAEEEAINQGMISIQQDGFIKALRGQTTIEEIMRATLE